MVEANTLQWPQSWPRTKKPLRARFDTRFSKARNELLNELRLLGARQIVISSNIELRKDGLPYANRPQPQDKGVAVYFLRDNKEQCIPCDKWDRIEDNLQAIKKTIGALRGLERWGAKDMVDAAFRGFQALPYYSDNVIMGQQVEQHFQHCKDLKDVEITWKSKRKYMHPDAGGSNEDFSELTNQYKKAKEKFR